MVTPQGGVVSLTFQTISQLAHKILKVMGELFLQYNYVGSILLQKIILVSKKGEPMWPYKFK